MVCGRVEEVLAAKAHRFILVRIKIVGCKIGIAICGGNVLDNIRRIIR